MNKVFLTGLCFLCLYIPLKAENLHVKFKNGHVDLYDSKKRLFTRKMCEINDQETKLKLTKKELKSISELANEIDFFDLDKSQFQPNTFEDKKGDIITVTCSPCSESYLSIANEKRYHTVHWDCGCGSGTVPDKLIPLVDKLTSVIYDKRPIKILSQSNCMFY